MKIEHFIYFTILIILSNEIRQYLNDNPIN